MSEPRPGDRGGRRSAVPPRTVRLILVSAAPTAALRAVRFPDDGEPVDPDGRRLAADAAAAGTLPSARRVHHDGSVRARQTAEALGLLSGDTEPGDSGIGDNRTSGAEPDNGTRGAGPGGRKAATREPGEIAVGEPGVGRAGVEVAVDAALRDLDVGAWRGRALDSIAVDELYRWHTDPAAAPPGGESRLALFARVDAWLHRRAAEPGRLIAVTHPAVIRAVLVRSLRCPEEMFWRIDVAPLTATTLHCRATPTGEASPSPDAGTWTLSHACRPLA